MAITRFEFQVVGNIVVPGAESSPLNVIAPNVASASFQKGDVLIFRAKDGDVSLVFSHEALYALEIHDKTPFTLTKASPISFEVKKKSSGNCCVTATPAGKAADISCTSVPAGILEIWWPVPTDPAQT